MAWNMKTAIQVQIFCLQHRSVSMKISFHQQPETHYQPQESNTGYEPATSWLINFE